MKLYLLLLLYSTQVFALGAHVHGLASVDIASDKKQVLIMFKSPGMSVFGFAHKPQNKEQEKIITQLKNKWEKAKFFNFDSNQCKVAAQSFKIDYSGKSHSEVKADITFNCDKLAKETKLNLNFNKSFKDVSTIHLQLMRADGSILNKKYKKNIIKVKL